MLEQNYQAATVEEAIRNGLNDLHVKESEVKIEVIHPGKKGFLGFGKMMAEVCLVVIDPELKKYGSIEALKARKITTKTQPNDTVQKQSINETNVEEKQMEADVSSSKTEVEAISQNTQPSYNEPSHTNIKNDVKTEVSDQQTKSKTQNLTEQSSMVATKTYVEGIITAMGYDVDATVEKVASNEVLINLESKDASRIIGKRGQILNSLQTLAQNFYNQLEKGYTVITLDIENYRSKRRETLQTLALNMSKKAIKTNQPVKFEPMPSYERKIMHQILANIENIETYSEGREPHRYLVIKAR